MLYAGKLDNARFIIDKVNEGYKFVHIEKVTEHSGLCNILLMKEE